MNMFYTPLRRLVYEIKMIPRFTSFLIWNKIQDEDDKGPKKWEVNSEYMQSPVRQKCSSKTHCYFYGGISFDRISDSLKNQSSVFRPIIFAII